MKYKHANLIFAYVPPDILKKFFNGVFNRFSVALCWTNAGRNPVSSILYMFYIMKYKNANLIFFIWFHLDLWFCSIYKLCRSRKKLQTKRECNKKSHSENKVLEQHIFFLFLYILYQNCTYSFVRPEIWKDIIPKWKKHLKGFVVVFIPAIIFNEDFINFYQMWAI